ncbi:alpha-ketoglutarate-dependent dioxygenase AlkB family protein [Aquimarina sp. 2201CG14-23]|uniref:alpha-ketoglutarate-dependent dioxygenase AlkB family protein n=1 Tax=Aquimarina mycalae TaxID=3040073 RepID=UPI0024781D58|nr:alpha-ketoglutarate-dependent dioxygenase AlkB [Aquimarina sp. 2201CG14-23]MDH7446883.1 alpha-ketoglutarate-dependent dioxygenase AlkB [Aquimarina sp. 2201CG14-23]
MDLFSSKNTPIQLQIPDGDVIFYPYFFEKTQADQLFEILLKSVQWQQDEIKIFGKTHPQPRLTALYANNKNTYSYSNITMTPHQFTEELLMIKNNIERIISEKFTTCLLNLYRDGQDSNGWHADDEKELGSEPVIASVSLGEERWFHFKHKTKTLKQKLLLPHGSLLIMKGKTQENWLHQIPKTRKIIKPRINLTFRSIH